MPLNSFCHKNLNSFFFLACNSHFKSDEGYMLNALPVNDETICGSNYFTIR
jgi:hypothetical protein